MIGIGVVFIVNSVSNSNQSLTNQTNAAQTTSNKELTSSDPLDLTNIIVQLDDLPAGWYQAVLEEDKKPVSLAEASRIQSVFRNKKNISNPEEIISLSNTIVLYKESNVSEEFLSRKSKFSTQSGFKKVRVGDDSFFYRTVSVGPATIGQPDKIQSVTCELAFVSEQYFVLLESYGQGLKDSTEEQNLEFLTNLANRIEGKITAAGNY